MNFSHLGPPPPSSAPDIPPVRLLSWAIIHDLTGLSEAVVSFNVLPSGATIPVVLLVMVCPRRLQVLRIKRLSATGDTGTMEPDELPGNLRDLALTKVSAMFCERTALRGGV